MSSLSKRLVALESAKTRDIHVWAHPGMRDEAEKKKYDEEYFRARAEEMFGINDFKLVVFPQSTKQVHDTYNLIPDVELFLRSIAENSTRIGVKPKPASETSNDSKETELLITKHDIFEVL